MVPVITQIQMLMVIIVYVCMVLKVHSVNMIIDPVNQILVGIMVSRVFSKEKFYSFLFKEHVTKHPTEHLNVCVKLVGEVRIVK